METSQTAVKLYWKINMFEFSSTNNDGKKDCVIIETTELFRDKRRKYANAVGKSL